jgi:peptidyl-prolyl cis-trans isomerase SurA
MAADGPFAARVVVNDRVVTNFEVEQRALFLSAINATGDLEAIALKDLIDDQLKREAASGLELELTEENVREGMAEFAGRANLSVEEFTQIIAEDGVAPETFRDFVESGLIWREVIREKFVGIVLVSEGEVDRAFAMTKQLGGVRVLLSELIIPAPEGEQRDALAQAQELAATIGSVDEFAEAAAQFSAAPSAEQGGAIDWIDIGQLPPSLRESVLTLQPGGITEPIVLPNAVGLFQLRGLEDTGRPAETAVRIDYVRVALPNTPSGVSEAQRLSVSADACNDLFALTRGLPDSQIVRETSAAGEVPRDIAIELAKLDPGQMSWGLQRGGTLVFLMLCARDMVPTVPEGAEPLTREQIRSQVLNEKLNLAAEGYLRQLRAAAVIREP